MLPETPRPPYPITWDEQDRLFARLPARLSRMVLFAVNTGLREGNSPHLCTFPHRHASRLRALLDRRFATAYGYMERVTIVKHALPRESNREKAFRRARRNLDALDVVDDPARIRGGNWNMQGLRRSGYVYDEAECQMSIAEFMADTQERYDIVE